MTVVSNKYSCNATGGVRAPAAAIFGRNDKLWHCDICRGDVDVCEDVAAIKGWRCEGTHKQKGIHPTEHDESPNHFFPPLLPLELLSFACVCVCVCVCACVCIKVHASNRRGKKRGHFEKKTVGFTHQFAFRSIWNTSRSGLEIGLESGFAGITSRMCAHHLLHTLVSDIALQTASSSTST